MMRSGSSGQDRGGGGGAVATMVKISRRVMPLARAWLMAERSHSAAAGAVMGNRRRTLKIGENWGLPRNKRVILGC